jgi:hypothetical protein
MIAEALDEATRAQAISTFQENVKGRKSNVNALEFAARVNKEIGLGSGEQMGGVVINVYTQIRPEKLR